MCLYQISVLYHEAVGFLILDYEPKTRVCHQVAQLPHQMASFISILCLQYHAI